MGRKSNMELLNEALERGDIEKAKELAKKIKNNKKEIVVIETEHEEKRIDKPTKIRRAAPPMDGSSETHIKQSVGTGKKLMTAAPMVKRKMDGWKDTRTEFMSESIKNKPHLGVNPSPRTREHAQTIEVQCYVCRNWFEVSESKVNLSGEFWRCSGCCKGGGE